MEVLSPSTEAYDRGEKLEHYKRIPALRACLFLAHDRLEIELWSHRGTEAWQRVLVGPGQTAELPVIGARLGVDELYGDAEEPRSA